MDDEHGGNIGADDVKYPLDGQEVVGVILVDVVRNVEFVVPDGCCFRGHVLSLVHRGEGGKGEGSLVVVVGPWGHHEGR